MPRLQNGCGGCQGNPVIPEVLCLSFFQVLLAKRKSDGAFYAVKVLQKKSILKNKEVPELRKAHFPSCFLISGLGRLPKMVPV